MNIANDSPIIGHFGVNKEGSGDMYNKGALMLNTLRHIVNDDAKWWALILKYSETYRHAIIDTQTVLAFFNKETGLELGPVFEQYLRTTKIPALKLKRKKSMLEYSWDNANADFNMPVEIEFDSKSIRLYPTTKVQQYKIGKATGEVKVRTDRFLITRN